jgi:hypothetical protein
MLTRRDCRKEGRSLEYSLTTDKRCERSYGKMITEIVIHYESILPMERSHHGAYVHLYEIAHRVSRTHSCSHTMRIRDHPPSSSSSSGYIARADTQSVSKTCVTESVRNHDHQGETTYHGSNRSHPTCAVRQRCRQPVSLAHRHTHRVRNHVP